MIPVLYSAYEYEFQTMGICPLSDCASVRVRRVLNGKDELEIKYPVDGEEFHELQNTRQILVTPEYRKQPQVYRIYQISKPIKGTVTVNARHISERKAFDLVKPFACNTIQEALVQIKRNLYTEGAPWTFWSNIYDSNERFVLGAPASLGSVLASLSKMYGGEFEFDGYDVKIHRHRGTGEQPGDYTVQILYGKNLTNLEAVEAIDERVITGICPIWVGENGDLVHLTNYIINSQYAGRYPFDRVSVVNFTNAFPDRPSEAALEQAAIRYMSSNNIGVPIISLKVSFVNLAQTQEYETLGVLERVNLGDTVFVRHADLGVDVSARITATDFDVLNEKYISVTVGQVVQNMSSALMASNQSVDEKVKGAENAVGSAVSQAVSNIAGANGGNILTTYDTDGRPVAIFIMDTNDKSTAVNVIRLNKDGIGFSNSGINGPYHIGWRIGDYVDIERGQIHITTISDGEDAIQLKYGNTECAISNKSIVITQKDTANNVLKQISIDVQDMAIIAKDVTEGWLKIDGEGVELYDTSDRLSAELSRGGLWFWPTINDQTLYPAAGWHSIISESAESVSTSWTKSSKIYTVQAGGDGWYMVEAVVDGGSGVAIGVLANGATDTKIAAINDAGSLPDIAGDTIDAVSVSCTVHAEAGDAINMYAQAGTAGQLNTALKIHGPLP